MIANIVERYKAVYVFVVMIIVLGFTSYLALPRESAPEIRRPLIFVTTVYPGVSPKDIESLITAKIEAELEGLKGLEKINSSSYEGMSQIVAEFSGDIDVDWALRQSKERVDRAKPDLPTDVDEPIVKELNFSDQPFLIIAISNSRGLEILENYIDYMEDAIENVPGVQEVVVSGNLEKELSIALDPAKLKHYEISIEDIKKSINDEHVTIAGGTLQGLEREYSLAISGELKTAKEFSEIVIQAKDIRVKLGDLAKVKFGHAEPESISRLNGVPAITLAVKKRGGANMLKIAKEIKDIVEHSKEKIPADSIIHYSFDESKDVVNMVHDLENNILSGLILVLLVTLFFLGPVNAIFVSLGIPFSMLMSFSLISTFGFTLNMVVLFSLVIALGMLVDNGIVIVENIYRHGTMDKTRKQAAIDGTREVMIPIITSTITTCLAFFPLIYMPGIMGEFMSYIPKTVITVLVSSLVVSLTITAVFCSRFLKVKKLRGAAQEAREKENEKNEENLEVPVRGFALIQKYYEKGLRWFLTYPITSLLLMTLLVFLGIFANVKGGRETVFFPNLDPKIAFVEVRRPTGSLLEDSNQFMKPIFAYISNLKASIDSLQTTIGASGEQGGARESYRSKLRLNFSPYVDRTIPAATTLDTIKTWIRDIAGAEIKVKEGDMGPPQGNDISYRIHGEDYEKLGDFAEQIKVIINEHSSVFKKVESDFEAAKPEYRIRINRELASRSGLSTRLIADTIKTAIAGAKIGVLRRDESDYDIRLRFAKPFRNHIELLKSLEIVKEGKRIPLNSVAVVSRQQTISQIKAWIKKLVDSFLRAAP